MSHVAVIKAARHNRLSLTENNDLTQGQKKKILSQTTHGNSGGRGEPLTCVCSEVSLEVRALEVRLPAAGEVADIVSPS